MRVLFLSSWFPTPPINGAKIRINNLLWYLTQRHEVTLISFVNTLSPDVLEVEKSKWGKICRGVHTIPRPLPNRLLGTIGLFTPLPKYIVSTYQPRIHKSIASELRVHPYDVLVAADSAGGGTGMAVYGALASNVPKILDEIVFGHPATPPNQNASLHSARMRLMLAKSKLFIKLLLRRYDASTVSSTDEYHNVISLSPPFRPPVIITNSVDLGHLHCTSQFPPDPNAAIFTGSVSYGPNADAMRYYLQDVLPFLHALLPNMQLKVTGNNSGFNTSPWKDNPAVKFVGFQNDIRSLICESWMTIVPLRQGMGTRLKIIESMALGTPVVSTSKGAEGLQVTPELDILIGDTPQQFAEQMARLSRDADLRTQLSINGRKTVEKFYDRAVTGKQFDELLQKVQKR